MGGGLFESAHFRFYQLRDAMVSDVDLRQAGAGELGHVAHAQSLDRVQVEDLVVLRVPSVSVRKVENPRNSAKSDGLAATPEDRQAAGGFEDQPVSAGASAWA